MLRTVASCLIVPPPDQGRHRNQKDDPAHHVDPIKLTGAAVRSRYGGGLHEIVARPVGLKFLHIYPRCGRSGRTLRLE